MHDKIKLFLCLSLPTLPSNPITTPNSIIILNITKMVTITRRDWRTCTWIPAEKSCDYSTLGLPVFDLRHMLNIRPHMLNSMKENMHVTFRLRNHATTLPTSVTIASALDISRKNVRSHEPTTVSRCFHTNNFLAHFTLTHFYREVQLQPRNEANYHHQECKQPQYAQRRPVRP